MSFSKTTINPRFSKVAREGLLIENGRLIGFVLLSKISDFLREVRANCGIHRI